MFRRSPAILLSCLLLAACGGREDRALRETREKSQAAQRRGEAALRGMDRKIEDLRARGESSAANAKADVRGTIAALEEKKTSVQFKLEELKTSSRDAAREIAEGLEKAADDLEKSYRDASSRFK